MTVLLSIAEAAIKSELSAQTLYEAIKRGELKCLRVGRNRMALMPGDFEYWLESRSRKVSKEVAHEN